MPQGAIEHSSFFDEEGEAVRAKAREEAQEDRELAGMMLHDRPRVAIDDSKAVTFSDAVEAVEPEMSDDDQGAGVGNAAEAMVGSNVEQDVSVVQPPVSPIPLSTAQPTTPRMSHSTRAHDDVPDEHDSKRSRVETQKKQRIERLAAEYTNMIRTVKVADDEFFTMDEYDTDLHLEQSFDPIDPGWDEDSVKLDGMPDELWSDFPIDALPPDPLSWVDELADRVEVERLKRMKVLIEEELYSGEPVKAKLTTKHVHDWRLKPFGDGKKWLRRSRLVAREFAFKEKRSDTFSPATSSHVMNVLPMVFLEKLAQLEMNDADSTEVTLGTVDVKDAFLMVDQPTPLRVQLPAGNHIVLKNLPGQRLGAKCWYWHFRNYLTSTFNMEWCPEQPCLCRNSECALMIHVDDVMFCGSTKYWNEVFLKKLGEQYTLNATALGEVGSSISFLKRKLVRLPCGLALVPGTDVNKVIQML